MAARTEMPCFVPAIQQLFIEPSDQRAAADERSAEAYAFLLGKSDDLDRKRQLSRFQAIPVRSLRARPPEHRHTRRHSGWYPNAIRSTALQRTASRTGVKSTQIACRIHARLSPQPRSAILKSRDGSRASPDRETCGVSQRGPRKGRQQLATRDDFVCASACVIKSGHEVSSLPAKPRLNGAVWLIDGHKNLVGVVLAEA